MVQSYKGWTAEKLDLFEDEIKDLFVAGKIRHPIHLSKGNSQQVLDVFSKYNIGDSDWVFSNHRSHFHALLKGIPKEWLKQQIITGHSMHLMSKEYKFFASSIVGGSIPIAVGVALAIKRQGLNERVFCFLGDMASLAGIAYECMLYSCVNELPIQFIIEDNGLSTNSPTYEAWGASYISYPDFGNVDYYKYTRTCPHINVDSFVEFK